jgi:uncharacterized repeat protein (TIGR04138 family)
MSTTSRTVERTMRYHRNAYDFVYQSLRYTQQSLNRALPQGGEAEDAHVTGEELLEGIRALALAEFGLMARTVFRRWGIRATHDFGRIVFELVERGQMSKTDRDQLSDFSNVYDFDEAFDRDYRVDVRKAFGS